MRYLVALISIFLSACSSMPYGSHGETAYRLKPYTVSRLPNGLKVLWIQDDHLPYLDFMAMVKTGTSEDPKGKEGLAEMTADMLDKGVKGRTAERIADDLEVRGNRFDASSGNDATWIQMATLSFYGKPALQDFYEFLTAPDFRDSELARQKRIILPQLKQIADQPGPFANLVFERYLYPHHPYGRMGTVRSISSISRADLVRFHHEHYTPSNTTLAVVGQITPKMKKEISAQFSKWSGPKTAASSLAKPKQVDHSQILLVTKPGLDQVQIRFGQIGVKRKIPDHLALKVANSILGSSFVGRLFKDIRIKKGLTYSIASNFDQRLVAGPFEIATFTRVDKVGEIVKDTMSELKNFRQNGVTQKEVDLAKAYLKGRFPRLLETGDDLARNLLYLDLYDLSDDYLKNFMTNIDKVTVAQVDQAIRDHIDPARMKVVVFAPDRHWEKPLSKVAPVEVKSYKSFLK